MLGLGATMVVMTKHAPIPSVPRGEYVPMADQRIVLGGVSWEAFEAFLALRGDARPLVTYLEGTLELMSPSRDHESIKKRFAEVVAAYLDHLGMTYEGVGSWLLKQESDKAGLEPDECFILHDMSKQRPDLAIEVVWTSGGMNKLEIYRRLGIREVWIWKSDEITVHALTEQGYEMRAASGLVPNFDFGLVAKMLDLPALSDVRRALREHFEQ
jgi:Uma2 family endonuclease